MKTYLKYKNELKELRDVEETMRVIEKIAAANIHFLELENQSQKEYIYILVKILSRISLFFDTISHPLFISRGGEKALLMVTSDKGLVGGLWHKMVEIILSRRKNYKYFICLGEKGYKYLKEESFSVEKVFPLGKEIFDLSLANQVRDYIFSEFKKGRFSQVDIIYPRFVSLVEQTPQIISFLPFSFEPQKEKIGNLGFPIFEPSKKNILNYFNYVIDVTVLLDYISLPFSRDDKIFYFDFIF